MSGVSPSRISYFEHGLFKPSRKEREKLVKALRVDVGWLFPADKTSRAHDLYKDKNVFRKPK
jgi:transcriptional regulator with XRE-family HTH domain